MATSPTLTFIGGSPRAGLLLFTAGQNLEGIPTPLCILHHVVRPPESDHFLPLPRLPSCLSRHCLPPAYYWGLLLETLKRGFIY